MPRQCCDGRHSVASGAGRAFNSLAEQRAAVLTGASMQSPRHPAPKPCSHARNLRLLKFVWFHRGGLAMRITLLIMALAVLAGCTFKSTTVRRAEAPPPVVYQPAPTAVYQQPAPAVVYQT